MKNNKTTSNELVSLNKTNSTKAMATTQNSFFNKSSSKPKQASALLMGKSVSNSDLRKRMTEFLENRLKETQRKRRLSSKRKATESSDRSPSKSSFSKTFTTAFFSKPFSTKKNTELNQREPHSFCKSKKPSIEPKDPSPQIDAQFSKTFSTSFLNGNSKFSINLENLKLLKKKIENNNSQGRTSKKLASAFITSVIKPTFVNLNKTRESTLQQPSRESSITSQGYYLEAMSKACTEENPDYIDHLFRDHLLQTHQAAKFADFLDPEDPDILYQLDSRKIMLGQSKFSKTLVFDLDETLVHCIEGGDIGNAKVTMRFPSGEIFEASINIRPHLNSCLKELSKSFELILFTASHSCYGEPVANLIDPNNEFFSYRLFRETCISMENGILVKDLRVLCDRDLSNVVLIDNSNFSFSLQPENGIPILPFYDYSEDNQLLLLTSFLKGLSGQNDVRKKLMKFFALHEFANLSSIEEAQKFSVQHYRDVVNSQM